MTVLTLRSRAFRILSNRNEEKYEGSEVEDHIEDYKSSLELDDVYNSGFKKEHT